VRVSMCMEWEIRYSLITGAHDEGRRTLFGVALETDRNGDWRV
jgi:hypothetical protein